MSGEATPFHPDSAAAAGSPHQDPPAPADGDTGAPVPQPTAAAEAPADGGSGEPTTGAAAEDIRRLESELEALRSENESLRGQYMRIAADFDNFRKRQSRDHEDLRLQIACSTLSEILPVVDNFERARQQLNPQHEEAKSLHGSYLGLYKQLVDVFKQLGVSPMRVEGEPFDPTLHEAVLREPSEHVEEDVVIEELQRGYHLNGRVLRHALVKVSMGPGPGGAPGGSGPQDGSTGGEDPT